MTADDFPLIGRWLAEPHVARWWVHDPSPAAVDRDFGPTLRGEEPAEDLIAELDGRPVGLCQRSFWHAYPDEVEEFADQIDVPTDAMTIDYLVGDPVDVGHGLGTELIRALAADTFAAHPDCGLLLVPVVAGNPASWRALEKAGFRFVGEALAAPDNPVDPPEHRVYRLDRVTGQRSTSPGSTRPDS
ncbi:GNAT family N-acetyltransferase [Actinomycetospora soli]|uniref:GNAT family N-acetyltransferase n=1 Tax=Actinomycetospora soli TaxID=2893887 RepID=UPI001E5CB300|nr:GNAT family N-acetyltransferase [Actinomycetospora soli]MCD2185662.1 acetyltransferase [Actinomycetospora soli]